MTLQLVTDSSADLPKNIIEKYKIEVVPLSIQFGNMTFIDGLELNNEDFYKMLSESEILPKTSRPAPYQFADTFQKLGKKGSVLCITLSSGLSGTYESALLASKMVEGVNVKVIDSLNASIGTGLQVIKACELIEKGLNDEEIFQSIIKYREGLNTYFTLDALEHIVKGGRLSSWEGALGKMLSIKPILYNCPNGVIGTLEKTRGRKRSLKRLISLVEETNKDFSSIRIGITHAQAKEEAVEIAEELNAKLKPKEIVISELGPIIGSHTGFGAVLISL